MTTAPLVRRHTERGVAVLTLDSPGNRNALSAELIAELGAALDEAGADAGVRAVMLTHAGPAFCAGADLKATGVRKGPQLLVDLMRQIAVLPKPVVARVDGHVRAGGMGLLAACDISVATHAASFAFTESRLGLAPAVASIPVLARADQRAAARWIITGERFDTEEAVRMGLVTDWAPALHGILAGLRAASPQGLAASKQLTTAAFRARLDADAEALCRESARLFATDDAAEGVRALLERREPPWAL